MIDAESIATALGGKRSGRGYRCQCPAHDGDSTDTLTLTDGDNQILVHCFAGCDFRDIAAELRKRGLWPDASPGDKHAYVERKRQREREHAKLVLEIASNTPELSYQDEQAVKRARQALR